MSRKQKQLAIPPEPAFDIHDFIFRCPECGYTDDANGFDCMGSDDCDDLFCNQCGQRFSMSGNEITATEFHGGEGI